MSPLLLGVILTFITGSGAVTVEILEPIRRSGDDVALIFNHDPTTGVTIDIMETVKGLEGEVALIFIPDSGVQGEQYRKTAQAIQAASHMRVWVALTGDYIFDTPNVQEIPRAVEAAIAALEDAGMASDNFVAVGHGMSGQYLSSYAEDSQTLKGLVMMGYSLHRDARLKDFPVPVLTLAAELDGLNRITRIAEEFEKLQEDLESSHVALYQTPVMVVEGANHAQFASGDMPRRIQGDDLQPSITEDEAHRKIGKQVSSFLTALFTTLADQKETALAELEEAFFNAYQIFKPFLEIKDLDQKGRASQWTSLAQERLAGEFADQIEISNSAGDKPWFSRSKPSIGRDGGSVVVETTTFVYYDKIMNNNDLALGRQSPLEISMKLKSKDAISKALSTGDGKPTASLKSKPLTCRSINEYAVEVALKHSSDAARERYLTRGRPIVFEDDANIWFEAMWGARPMKTWVDDQGLHVRSVAFETPGSLYCKVVSPSRVMEWINIDSLREY